MSKINFALLPLLACLSFSACGGGKTLHWSQEVQLHDGRVIVMERVSERTGNIVPENVSMEKSQSIAFVSPDTNEKITWSIPKGLLPYTLDFENKIPYLVLVAYTVADYNAWNCPNPPYLVYRYGSGSWVAIPFEQLPGRIDKRNLIDMSKMYEKYATAETATVDDMKKFLKRREPDGRVISREKVSAIAKGCLGSTLHRLGRQSEIDYRKTGTDLFFNN